MRQRRLAQHELTTPHPITSLAAQLPACRCCPHCQAEATQLAPLGWSRGLRRYRCKQVCAPVPFSPRRLWPDFARHNAGRLRPGLIDGLTVRQAAVRCGVCKTPPSCGVTVSWPWRVTRGTGRGIVEVDETFFLESFKGQRGSPRPARHRGAVERAGLHPGDGGSDRAGHHADFQLENECQTVIAVLTSRQAVLCSDTPSKQE